MATGVGDSVTGRHERHVVGECRDLPAGFVGIMSEESISCYNVTYTVLTYSSSQPPEL